MKNIKIFTILLLCMGTTFCLNGCKSTESVEDKSVSLEETEDEEKEQKKEKEEVTEVKEDEDNTNSNVSEALMVRCEKHFANYYEEQDYSKVVDAYTEYPVICSEGYEELKKAVLDYQEKAISEADSFSKEGQELYEEMGHEAMGPGGSWFYSDDAIIKRADDKVFSLINMNSTYTGGAHPFTYLAGINFDTASGKILELSDVINDLDKFEDILVDLAAEKNEDSMFFEDWEDTIRNSFSAKDDSGKCGEWILTKEGIEVIYNAYELGPYAMGDIHINLPYDEYSDLINDEYKYNGTQTVFAPDAEYGDSYKEFNIDINGDGKKELITVNAEDVYSDDYNPETDYNKASDFVVDTTIKIGVGKDYDETTKNTAQTSGDLGITKAYVMLSDNGKYYLYIENASYNDYKFLKIFDVSDVSKSPVVVSDGTAEAFYGYIPFSADCFILADRFDTMGTYSGYAKFHLGEDGLPMIDDKWFDIYTADYDRSMTLLQDFEVLCFEDIKNIDGANRKTLSKGTKLIPYYTDGEDEMIFKLDDGNFVLFKYSSGESWPRQIDGINEEELLDTPMYCG